MLLFIKILPTSRLELAWRQGTPAPETMSSVYGAAVVHHNTAYFSEGYNVYSYSTTEDKWAILKSCPYKSFGMAVVNDKLTTIGGCHVFTSTNALFCLTEDSKWADTLPPMTTSRIRPAAVSTRTNLVVAGGSLGQIGEALSRVEVLDTNALQWSSACSLPVGVAYPSMVLNNGHLYLLSEPSSVFSCSIEELLKTCKHSAVDTNVWTKLADVPIPFWANLATLYDEVVVVGGSVTKNMLGGNPIEDIYSYDKGTNTWSITGKLPTPRSACLVAVVPPNELIVVGGKEKLKLSNVVDCANL